jgi:hypothetical protein
VSPAPGTPPGVPHVVGQGRGRLGIEQQDDAALVALVEHLGRCHHALPGRDALVRLDAHLHGFLLIVLTGVTGLPRTSTPSPPASSGSTPTSCLSNCPEPRPDPGYPPQRQQQPKRGVAGIPTVLSASTGMPKTTEGNTQAKK